MEWSDFDDLSAYPEAPEGYTPDWFTGEVPKERFEFTKGLLSGKENLQAMGGGAVALAGEAIGSEGMRDWGMEVYERNTEEAQQYQGKTVNFDDIDGPVSAFEFFMFHAGSALPTFAPMIGNLIVK
ncbi:MAG TPA: hypothetical protein DCZ12_17240, partial [Gammaproteobacteria bacterium]|nr:hypothetical protein [Gammaproteobacteria bacterium]